MLNYEFVEFFEELDELYPDGIVHGLRKNRKIIFNQASSIAELQGKTVKEFFEECGYTYISVSLNKLKSKDKKDLKKIYNGKIVRDLRIKNYNLYYRILNHAKTLDLTIGEYLNQLGFEYDKYDTLRGVKVIEKELKQFYPNKKVRKLSIKSNALYSRIYKVARREGKSVEEFVVELGFDYK